MWYKATNPKYRSLWAVCLVSWVLALGVMTYSGWTESAIAQAAPLWASAMLMTLAVVATVASDPGNPNPNAEKVKMYCVFAKESLDKMKGVRGKMLTQAGHGYLHAFWDSMDRFPLMVRAYRQSGRAYKITLVVPLVSDLERLEAIYRDVCGVSLVTDAGLTVFKDAAGNPVPTTTCLGIGPIMESQIEEYLGGLKTLT
jgi:peptidyl-tRNA hydrolase